MQIRQNFLYNHANGLYYDGTYIINITKNIDRNESKLLLLNVVQRSWSHADPAKY